MCDAHLAIHAHVNDIELALWRRINKALLTSSISDGDMGHPHGGKMFKPVLYAKYILFELAVAEQNAPAAPLSPLTLVT